MPRYSYVCRKCGEFEVVKPVSRIDSPEICIFCMGKAKRQITFPNVVGTRDNFGISRAFYDPKTKQEISNWKTWEKAGFRDPLDMNMKNTAHVKDKIKYWKKHKDHPKTSKAVEMSERI